MYSCVIDYIPTYMYKTSVPVQGCTLPLPYPVSEYPNPCFSPFHVHFQERAKPNDLHKAMLFLKSDNME